MTSSPGSSPFFLITTLAEYQTVFWALVGQALRASGARVLFLSFDDRSHESLLAQGLDSLNAYDLAAAAGPAAQAEAFDGWVRRLGMADAHLWLGHERASYGINDGRELRRKFCVGAAAAEAAIRAAREKGGEPLLVQELGGFLSVVGSFFAARSMGVHNLFLEPSFYKGRLFFLRDTFGARDVPAEGGQASAEVSDYLDRTLAQRSIAIPSKDRHHYNPALQKVANSHNFRRLVEKARDRFLLGKRQEFRYLGFHVKTHVKMLANSARLAKAYTPLSALDRFIYYPLHVPGDVALTLRAPAHFDQLALVDFLARATPHTHRLAIKEHPAMIGALDAGRLKDLLRRYDNLAILPPRTNNFDVLKAASAVVTVNSKSGAEALLAGKPVLALGDAFYKRAPGVQRVDSPAEIPAALEKIVAGDVPVPASADVRSFFQSVWERTRPGDLYVPTPEAADRFAQSLLAEARAAAPAAAA